MTEKSRVVRLLSVVLLALLSSACITTSDSPTHDNSVTNGDKSKEILNELKQIRVLLQQLEKNNTLRAQKKAVPSRVSISSKGRPTLGDKNAPLTLIEFSDYQCPYCKRFYIQTLPKLKTEYIDKGKLRLVFKDLPLKFHKQARGAAMAAQCAGEQDKFWQMHDMLFENNKKLQEKYFMDYAERLTLNTTKFRRCLKDQRFEKQINQDIKQASVAGITGTPSFILGKTTDDIVNGVRIRGAVPFYKMKTEITKLLKTKNR